MKVYKDTKKVVFHVIDKDFLQSKTSFFEDQEIWQGVEIVCSTTIESPCQSSSLNSGTLKMLQRLSRG